ncbi:hypothetical protein C8A00DRAFT_14612 [Chaetomidium leptoderma]|uniref:Uncharacterized protein n=1 Tax=Chaetomidium leptoderma TaxID=669021 RepID=A0AAN6VN65_9PEZI|nr:hypothetical protein C8A00DRAFT_14612 [Chaetomidium leptoderma]
MCSTGYNHFSCGCAVPIDSTLQQCEYAKIKGQACPSFQCTEDTSSSKTFDLMACMAHS